MSVRVTVGVPASRPATVIATIRSLQRQTFDDIEIVVCGQGRHDGDLRAVVEEAARHDARIRYVHSPVVGCSAARNTVIEHSDAEVVAFTDDDCEVADDWVEVLIDRFERYPQVGLVGGTVVAPPRPRTLRPVSCPGWEPEEALYDPEVGYEDPEKVPFIGANFAVRREQVAGVGGFDEALGPGAVFPSADDTDFGFRLAEAPIAFATTPEAVVHHTHGYRVGFRARYRLLAAYALGSGALARKRTLTHPDMAAEWYQAMEDLCVRNRSFVRIDRLVIGRVRWHYFRKGFDGYGAYLAPAA